MTLLTRKKEKQPSCRLSSMSIYALLLLIRSISRSQRDDIFTRKVLQHPLGSIAEEGGKARRKKNRKRCSPDEPVQCHTYRYLYFSTQAPARPIRSITEHQQSERIVRHVTSPLAMERCNATAVQQPSCRDFREPRSPVLLGPFS